MDECRERRSRGRSPVWIGIGLALVGTGALAALAAGSGMIPALAQVEPLDKRVHSVFLMTPLGSPELLKGQAVYVENLPARPGQPMLCRSERRYSGAMPTADDLSFYLRQGMGDAFLAVLRPEFKAGILAELIPVEAAFGAASLRRHQEVEAAKAALKGTQDEFVIETLTEEGRLRKREVHKRRERTDRSREIWVSQSTPTVEVHYRIDLQRFPGVAEFEREAARHELLRKAVAHERVAALVTVHGAAALDPNELAAATERARAARSGRKTP